MNFKNPIVFLTGSMLGLVTSAVGKPGYENTPKIPGTEYSVHDMARPQPPVIETSGAVTVAAPSDAKVLFDGSDLSAWTSGGGEPAWKVKDGVMIASGKDLQTKESFGAIQLHFEWRLAADREVDGQKGGNSGCFLMGLYEVQVLQSNNNETYPDGQAGALYGQLPPLVNATSPQGEWNSYDIFFSPPEYDGEEVIKPARVTVIHNGVVVQNGEDYLGPTRHKRLASYPAEHPEVGPLKFQFHQDPVEYRNVWVRPLGGRE
ncbi:DUF1080 domain-containing protein [Luteolibacter sp. AS25]|uniref:3-keto-disaccharide hydrolase n=1 Tax=Luteolibacter sp. AS25 TaxID=3135776 RepID=UPI00398B08C8